MYAVESTPADGRWPAFRAAAAADGIGSTLWMPMIVDGQAVGAMNLYARPQNTPFGDEARDIGMQLASQAAIVPANAQSSWYARTLSEGLRQSTKAGQSSNKPKASGTTVICASPRSP